MSRPRTGARPRRRGSATSSGCAGDASLRLHYPWRGRPAEQPLRSPLVPRESGRARARRGRRRSPRLRRGWLLARSRAQRHPLRAPPAPRSSRLRSGRGRGVRGGGDLVAHPAPDRAPTCQRRLPAPRSKKSTTVEPRWNMPSSVPRAMGMRGSIRGGRTGTSRASIPSRDSPDHNRRDHDNRDPSEAGRRRRVDGDGDPAVDGKEVRHVPHAQVVDGK